MSELYLFLAEYGSRILAGAAIMVIRYMEKRSLILHMKRKEEKKLNPITDDKITE